MKFIKTLEELTKKDVTIAGGKGAALGELMRAMVPVPHGFVVLSAAYKEFLKEKRMPKAVAEEIKAECCRAQKRINKKDISVAVVVQKMVKVDAAGICFTAHPVTGERGKMIIEAVRGL